MQRSVLLESENWNSSVCVRRERIYPFRLGNVFIGGILNGKMLILFVGNGFIRSAPLIVSKSVGQMVNTNYMFPKIPLNELR